MSFLTNEQLRRGFPLEEINRYVQTGNGAVALKLFDDWVDEQGGTRYAAAYRAAKDFEYTVLRLFPSVDISNVAPFKTGFERFVAQLDSTVSRFQRGERIEIADALYYENFLWRNSQMFDDARKWYNDAEFALLQTRREHHKLGNVDMNAASDAFRHQPRPIDERQRDEPLFQRPRPVERAQNVPQNLPRLL